MWRGKDFWVEKIKNITDEWRITVFDGKVIARGLKWPGGEPVRKSVVVKRGLEVRNRMTGWVMRHDVEPTDEMREIAKKAVKCLGDLYGGVDIVRAIGERLFVLEVNTGQGMDNYTCGQYVKAVKRWVGVG